MKTTRIGALAAAAMLTLTFAGTAFANDLHQDTPIVGTQFDNTEVGCDEGWHFVHTDAKSGSLPSTLTATFQNAGKVEVAGYVNGNSIVMYNVYVDPSDTLLSASDTISNDGNLNLSHVCLPEETTTSSESTTTTESTKSTTTTESTETETTTTESTTTTTVETTTETTETTPETTTTDETTTTQSTETETTTPDGSVEELTPPSTDTLAPTSSSTVSTGLLLVLAGILAAVLVVVPAAARSRR